MDWINPALWIYIYYLQVIVDSNRKRLATLSEHYHCEPD